MLFCIYTSQLIDEIRKEKLPYEHFTTESCMMYNQTLLTLGLLRHRDTVSLSSPLQISVHPETINQL